MLTKAQYTQRWLFAHTTTTINITGVSLGVVVALRSSLVATGVAAVAVVVLGGGGGTATLAAATGVVGDFFFSLGEDPSSSSVTAGNLGCVHVYMGVCVYNVYMKCVLDWWLLMGAGGWVGGKG